MGDYNRNGMYMIGGVVLGLVSAAVLGQQKNRLRPAVAGLISRGLDVKDSAVVAAESVKEQAEDLLAEAEDMRQKRTAGTPVESAATDSSTTS